MKIYEDNYCKMYQIFKKLCQYVLLPPNRGVRGVDLRIPMTINSTIFGFVMVNHAHDLMCLKFEAILMNKQHPSIHDSIHVGSVQ